MLREDLLRYRGAAMAIPLNDAGGKLFFETISARKSDILQA
jgi:hypothetical protein